MLTKAIEGTNLDLDINDIRLELSINREEGNPKKGATKMAIWHPNLKGSIRMEGELNSSDVMLVRKGLFELDRRLKEGEQNGL